MGLLLVLVNLPCSLKRQIFDIYPGIQLPQGRIRHDSHFEFMTAQMVFKPDVGEKDIPDPHSVVQTDRLLPIAQDNFSWQFVMLLL